MAEFPVSVNDQLPKLRNLYNVYASSADTATTNNDHLHTLGENPSLLDVATWLGGRIEQVRQGQGVLADAVAQNMKDVELHQRQINWLQQDTRRV